MVMQTTPHKTKPKLTPRPVITLVKPPPLQSGDRLTRREFERRYQAMSNLNKAELIEGVVYMPSPVSMRHSESHGYIMGWLATYCAATPGVHLYDNATVRLDLDNEVQPDALLRLDEAVGGKCKVSEDNYLEGAPELVVEVAASSAAYDLHDKLKIYRRNGVQEYLIWQIYDNELLWLSLNDEGEYAPLQPDEAGIIRSRVFSGLILPAAALLAGQLAEVLDTLRQDLGQGEHKIFAETLGA